MTYKTYNDLGRDDNQKLEISIGYQEGGINWANHKQEERGLYVHFSLVKIEERGAFQSVSRMLFAGTNYKILALPMTRRNAKTQEALESFLDKFKDSMVQYYKDGNRQALFNMVTSFPATLPQKKVKAA